MLTSQAQKLIGKPMIVIATGEIGLVDKITLEGFIARYRLILAGGTVADFEQDQVERPCCGNCKHWNGECAIFNQTTESHARCVRFWEAK